jgi:hypothetical protein
MLSCHRLFKTIAFGFALCVAAGGWAQPLPAGEPEAKLQLKADRDCSLFVDDHLVGRMQGSEGTNISIPAGKHQLSALAKDGELWERSVDGATVGQALTISFAEAQSERETLQKENAALQDANKASRSEVSSIAQENEQLALHPEAVLAERRLIATALDYYQDRFGKELGLQGSRTDSSNDLAQSAALSNLGPTNTATSVGALAEYYVAWRLSVKAHRNELAAAAASSRVHELEYALENPLKHPLDAERSSYLVMVRPVVNDQKVSGKLITTPGMIRYQGSDKVEEHSCDALKHASGGKTLALQFVVGTGKKAPKDVLKLKAANKIDQEALIGDVYLACPKLTE